MRRLVTIDLSAADTEKFEHYESIVLPLVEKYGGRLEFRLRTFDGSTETHLLFFPDEQNFENYRADSVRQAAQILWDECGARSVFSIVECVN
jgi:uncharacterized protein (DUF1330 family)